MSVSMAPTAASAKKIAGTLAPRVTATTFAAISWKRAWSTRRRVSDLRPDEVAVELGRPDGDASSDERSGHHSGIWLLVLQRNGQRESDDRAIDKARELTSPEVLVEGAWHRGQYQVRRGARPVSDSHRFP
jgi:hypothetical protein